MSHQLYLCAYAYAELTRRRPFVDTGRLVVIRRKLLSDRVTVDCGIAFLLFGNGGSIQFLGTKYNFFLGLSIL